MMKATSSTIIIVLLLACSFVVVVDGFLGTSIHHLTTGGIGRLLLSSDKIPSYPQLQASVSGPKSGDSDATTRRRRSPTRPHRQRQSRRRPSSDRTMQQPFNGKAMSATQVSNDESATLLDLEAALAIDNEMTDTRDKPNPLRCVTHPETLRFEARPPKQDSLFAFASLDDLFQEPFGLSQRFHSDATFRSELRKAIRKDVFDTTPFYANLSERAASVLLLPDSSLEGSWRIPPKQCDDNSIRMKSTTAVLRQVFGDMAPTGDDLFTAIGNLCGSHPSTHFIDIYGVQDRLVSHSWHMDSSGGGNKSRRTVLWGFPPEDNYEGCGVFSHLVPLQSACRVADDDNSSSSMEPVLFDGSIDATHIVRPTFAPGRELISYRDMDVLHSAPDVTYRTSVMRFM